MVKFLKEIKKKPKKGRDFISKLEKRYWKYPNKPASHSPCKNNRVLDPN